MSNLIENKSDLTLNVLTEAQYKKLFENTNNAINHNPFSDYEFIDTWKQEHESAELSDFTQFLQSNQLYLTVDEETGEVTVAQLIEKTNYLELSANNEVNPNILYCVINDPEDSDHVSINSDNQQIIIHDVIVESSLSSVPNTIKIGSVNGTDLFAPTVTAPIVTEQNIEVEQIVTEGTRIASITVGDDTTDLFAPKTDCVSYVIESGKFYSGTGIAATGDQTNDSWYRLYSDGWCEQGGKCTYLATDGTNTKTINLFKSYYDDSYTVIISAASSGQQNDSGHIVNEDKSIRTKQKFGIQVVDINGATKDSWNCWKTEGFTR